MLFSIIKVIILSNEIIMIIKTHNNIILNLLKKLKETFKYKVNIVF